MKKLAFILSLSLLCMLLTSCSNMFYYPSRDEFYSPKSFNIDYEDHYFQSNDGLKLHGWFLKTSQDNIKGTIVHFHGNAENITTHFLSLAWLVNYGYQIFIFDYRGYGKSEGKTSQKGIYFDALAAFNYSHRLHKEKGAGKYIVYGQSLGGIISLRALMDFPKKKDIHLVVMDSTFSSYQKIAFDKMTDSWITIPFSPLVYLLISDEMESFSHIQNLSVPLLVIHGDSDKVVPYKFGKEIYVNSPNQIEKWMWSINGGKHTDVFFREEGKYRKKFVKFLENI